MNYTKITNERMGETYYRLKHPSGLTIVVWPKEDYNTTHAMIATHFGSNNAKFVRDDKAITVPDGTAHFLEHKLFESEEGPAFTLYAKTGASANAFTSFDTTCVVGELCELYGTDPADLDLRAVKTVAELYNALETAKAAV